MAVKSIISPGTKNMLRLACDYQEGCHPKILERMVATNMESTAGYGMDPYCESAREKIKAACGNPDAVVHLLVGGTQTNATVIRSILRPCEGVVSVTTGHINGHEAGAIELGGHKVLTIPHVDGKMVAADLRRYLENVYKDAAWQHGVIPGMVYVSQATETGSVYTLAELTALSEVCRECKLPLFLDGARLGYALMSEGSDMTLEDIARLCDVFYIGGTKVGALLGEAVVFSNAALAKHFFTIMKQGGAVLAKGRLLGLQFDTLFTDNLYMEISRHAIDMAMKLKHGLKAKGYTFFTDSPSNQQFIVLDNEKMRELAKHVAFTQWALVDDDHTAIRLCTSWATTEETIDAVLSYL